LFCRKCGKREHTAGRRAIHEQKCKNVSWAIERAKLFEEMDARLAGAPAHSQPASSEVLSAAPPSPDMAEVEEAPALFASLGEVEPIQRMSELAERIYADPQGVLDRHDEEAEQERLQNVPRDESDDDGGEQLSPGASDDELSSDGEMEAEVRDLNADLNREDGLDDSDSDGESDLDSDDGGEGADDAGSEPLPVSADHLPLPAELERELSPAQKQTLQRLWTAIQNETEVRVHICVGVCSHP
jgi:hypothetical protein